MAILDKTIMFVVGSILACVTICFRPERIFDDELPSVTLLNNTEATSEITVAETQTIETNV